MNVVFPDDFERFCLYWQPNKNTLQTIIWILVLQCRMFDAIKTPSLGWKIEKLIKNLWKLKERVLEQCLLTIIIHFLPWITISDWFYPLNGLIFMFSSTSGLFISSYAAYFILGLMRKINFICQIYLHNCRYFELHKQGDNLSISTIYWLRIIGAFPRKGKEMTI